MEQKNNVKTIRQGLNMTQLDLVIATKIAQSDLSQVENGKKFPFPEWRRKISEALGKSEQEVFPNVS